MGSESMAVGGVPGPLLATKLYAPRPRRGSVPRPRLSLRLDRGIESKLTLISAPPGFGKTTLVTEWLAATPLDGRRAAWLSLDPGDNEPATFWTYLVRALQSVAPEVGTTALGLLQAGEARTEAVVAALVNELAAMTSDVVLVLDDYHVIERLEILDGLGLLLERMPDRLHVVITTRADPALPLARLRARGELVEIRAADLRFTSDEAATYLNEAMGLALDAPDVEALEGRTEGWIAALQLAAISLQGRTDPGGFIASFAGEDRYIVDYLVEEVLQRQPEQIRSFLLKTSILTRMTGSLCAAVTGQDGGRATLAALDRGNLFLVPLDDRRRWYRFHHLFADVLRARLVDERANEVPGLHRLASAWYAENGERSEAIRHAMAAGDYERAADLIELAIPETRRARQERTLRGWLEALPDELFQVRPVLSVGYAGALMAIGEFEGVEALLTAAEDWLETALTAGRPGDATMVVVDDAEFRRLPSAIALYRVAQARMLGDMAGTVERARHALEVIPEDDHVGRGGVAALLALVDWTNGDLEGASRWYADGMAGLERAGHVTDVVGGSIIQADLLIGQGRLDDALRTYERGLQLAWSRGEPPLRGAADMHVGMSSLLLERNDLAGATQQLRLGRELGEDKGFPQNPYRWRVAAAGIRHVQGDLEGAAALLDEAERVYLGDFSPDVRPIAAVRARLWIAHGKLAEAGSWAREHGITTADELSYLHEFEHATLARLLLAQGRRDASDRAIGAVIELAERLLSGAEAGRRNGSTIDILVVQALGRHALHEPTGALSLLARAVALAEPEGYVRVFLDEGAPMVGLLKLAASQRNASAYVRRLLAAAGVATGRLPADQSLVEPLSERELEVLRLLASDLDGPGIARELTVSLNTIRTHTKNVYAKLGVNSRRAAVSRAAELSLLTRTRERPAG